MTVKKLVEKSTATIASRDSGGDRYRMRVISAGAGSSATYPAAVLERDLAAAFPQGTRMRGNHDGWFSDGGDVMRLMAKTVSSVEWDAEEQAGFAEFQVAPQFNEWFLTFADVIGVSVQALAEAQWPEDDADLELDGPILPVITRLLPASEAPYNSIDFVEAPGANGRIVQALESLRSIAHEAFGITETSRLDAEIARRGTPESPVTEKGNLMDEETLARLIEAAVSKAVPGAVTEALKPAEPKDEKPALSAVAEAIVAAGLSDEGRSAVYEALEAGKPLEATIEREKTRESKMREAIKAQLVEEHKNDVQRTGVLTSEGASKDGFASEFDDVFTQLEENAGRPVAQKVGA